MQATATPLGFRRRGLPPLAGPKRLSQAAIQAEMLRGALVPNSQSISPTPDPLPPAPLLGLAELAAIGAAAALGEVAKRIEQLWGLSNSRPGIQPQRVELLKNYPVGSKSRDGSTQYQITGGTVTYASSSRSPNGPDAVPVRAQNLTYGGNSYLGASYSVRVDDRGYAAPVYVVLNNGTEVGWDFVQLESGISVETPILRMDVVVTATAISDGPVDQLTGDPFTTFQPDLGAYIPKTAPGPLVLAPMVRIVEAATAGQQQPTAQAKQPTATAEEVAPVVVPAVPLVQVFEVLRQVFYAPARLPSPLAPPAAATQQTTTAGALVPRVAEPVPTTANDARRYGSRTITAGAPRVDPQAIAEELGRVEQKLGILLQGADTTPDWLDALAGRLIGDLLAALIDALVVDVPGTSYGFTAPCDKDANGDPVEWSANIAAADYQPAVVARLDAIAEALGVLKGWRQPICRVTPPSSNVTVTAYEVGPEA